MFNFSTNRFLNSYLSVVSNVNVIKYFRLAFKANLKYLMEIYLKITNIWWSMILKFADNAFKNHKLR